jgi:putative NADH-flavin reductase
MNVLLLGASGATGKLVGLQLLKHSFHLRVVVRKNAVLLPELLNSSSVEVLRGDITEFSPSEIAHLVEGCDAVISCLGHNVTAQGMFGKPRFFVSDTLKNVCKAITKNAQRKVKVILMNTTAFTNKEIGEKNTVGEKIIFSFLLAALPPHNDNMKAVNYLLQEVGTRNEKIEWVAVRPDALFDESQESTYIAVESLQRSPLFNPGRTSRINVSHFMSQLLVDKELWQKWNFKTPVLYNECENK